MVSLSRRMLAVVATTLVVCSVAVAYRADILRLRIKGVVDVPSTLLEREVELVVTSQSGERTYTLGTVKINHTHVKAVAYAEEVSGSFKIVVSGALVLSSKERSYTIDMPCLLAVNETCFRIMSLIPGYDAPLLVVPGEYEVTLHLRWINGAGRGSFILRILLVGSQESS